MSYKALLFCPDERTAKTVTQVLNELEFQVEACNEPFAAVKRLMAGHFDAVVVDCDNEQNATLLFKSARNSEFNQASLSVAVVEGQSGVAKAFRIGANLVLTKPINVEQSKGTLRVARGLLRKNEAAKASGTAPVPPVRSSSIAPPPSQPVSIPAAPKPAFLTHAAPLAPTVTASSSSAFELEKDPAPGPEPTEAALLESMPDPLAARSHHSDPAMPAPKQYPWQTKSASESAGGSTMSESMSTALKHASEATGKPDSGIGVGYGAAVAPAKEPAQIDDGISSLEETAEHSSSSRPPVAKPRAGGSAVNWGRIAAIVLVAVAGYAIYRAGTLTHWQMSSLSSLMHRAAVPAAQPSTPRVPATSANPSATTPLPQPGTVKTVSPQNSNATGATPSKPSPAPESAALAPAPKKPAVPSTSFDPPIPPGVVKTFDEANADAIVVNTQTPVPAPPKPATAENIEPASPESVSTDSKSNEQAISGLISIPASVPRPGPQTLKISQGVSQGLLIKKVAPIYPQRAMQAHLQGSVQLLATISKNGDISHVKLLNGEPVLAQAAMDAVKQWKYKPYLLDGQPMDIQTQITINFSLPQ